MQPVRSMVRGTLPAEQRIVLQRVGLVDPYSIEDYIVHDGYEALGKALSSLSPAQVIEEIEKSGLRGRGGAGFPSATKWRFVQNAPGSPKYVICNADESEPGTFKDRVILEGDPFNVLEAMTLAAYAVGASEGYIYLRGEYTLAASRLANAIEQAYEMGFLGKNIFESGFNFDIAIHSGSGAYICGEETALLESLEGKRGEPRPRPPYPPSQGLWGKPTLINNVETLANIPPILRNGAGWFHSFGTPSSPGTKVFSILGNVNVTGLIEVPMGITLREIIDIYALGMKPGSSFKLAQTGGSSGTIIPAALQDTPLDFDSFKKDGVALGSGALMICDEKTCVVDLTKVLVNFFRSESCGKCTPCRIGNRVLSDTLDKITEGEGQPSDLQVLSQAVQTMAQSSFCGLGQSVANPVNSALRYFKAEFESHIVEHFCPAAVCTELFQYVISPEHCNGCHLCVQACSPWGAIAGCINEIHTLDVEKCVQCGACVAVCPENAIIGIPDATNLNFQSLFEVA